MARNVTRPGTAWEVARALEVAVEARLLLQRHRAETLELETRFFAETAAMSGVTLRRAA